MIAQLLIAGLMIASAVLLIGFLLMLRNKSEEPTGSSTGQSMPAYGDCSDLCSTDSKEASDACMALCAYGWP